MLQCLTLLPVVCQAVCSLSDCTSRGLVIAVTAGTWHTCVVKANQELVCFGNNDYGQCDVPPGLGPVIGIAAGTAHTCVVKANHDVVSFGGNYSGQCNVPAGLKAQ